VTGSVKTGIIAHYSRFDFSSQAQSFVSTLSNFTVKISQSGIAGFFFQAQWQALRTVSDLVRALANQEMAVCGCTVSWH